MAQLPSTTSEVSSLLLLKEKAAQSNYYSCAASYFSQLELAVDHVIFVNVMISFHPDQHKDYILHLLLLEEEQYVDLSVDSSDSSSSHDANF